MAGDYQQNLDSELELKRNFLLKEAARCHASQSKFHEAVRLLESMHDDIDESNLQVNLLLLECLVQLGKEIKANRIEGRLERVICCAPIPDASVVNALAGSYYVGGIPNCVRALVIRKLLANVHLQSDQSSEEKFTGIAANLHECNRVLQEIFKGTNQANKVAEDIAKSFLKKNDDDDNTKSENPVIKVENRLRLFTIGMDYGMEYMLDMYKNLKRMPGVDWTKRAKDLASCANSIGYLYCAAGENKKSIFWRREGIRVMEDQYRESVTNYNLYGDLHHNIGVCLYNLDRCLEAKDVYTRAIEIYQMANDYGSESDREKDLKQSRSDLKDTKDRL